MARFEERAPLEFTKPSTKQILLVCPNCKTGQYRGKNWFSGQCIKCRKVFKKDDSLSEEKMKSFGASTKTIPNPEKIKLKSKVEKQAYEFQQKTAERKRQGVQRSHEPGGKPRGW